MDFKLCGTEQGITGFQLDLKLAGIPLNLLEEANFSRLDARLKILEVMKATWRTPRRVEPLRTTY